MNRATDHHLVMAQIEGHMKTAYEVCRVTSHTWIEGVCADCGTPQVEKLKEITKSFVNPNLSYCEWHLDDDESNVWASACGEMWCLDTDDPKGNDMKFCPFCGLLLIQRELSAEESEEDT